MTKIPYMKTPRGRYAQHKANTKQRKIGWELTFEEWWDIWQSSGKWEMRGIGPGQYVMARFNDTGPYAVDNVKIVTNGKNWSEGVHHRRKKAAKSVPVDRASLPPTEAAWYYPNRDKFVVDLDI